ncbi:MAG: hypothetical protein IJV65_09615 [Kiritimatiellae bacterium]|nr:hypothetical protein [Kiritimatiellia bacterium]
MKRILSALLFALAAASASAADYKSMWITDVLSGRTIGPVVNKPGNRFPAGGRQWVVLRAGRGETDFADAATMKSEGPFALVEQRMFTLGDAAYVFTRVADFEGDDPGADAAVVSQAERAPAEKGRHPWSADLPERWVLAPLPSTNPGAHKEPGRTWHLERLQVAPSATAWFEPVVESRYDWELGGMAGNKGVDFERRRVGASGYWNGFSAEAALVASGKSSGSLVPDGTSLSSLSLSGGSGWRLAAGYEYAAVIDGGWSATAAAYGVYESVSVDAKAVTTKEKDILVESVSTAEDGTETVVETTEKGYGFSSWGADATLEDARLGVALGLQYDDWYWGADATVLVDCWSDTSIDVSVPVLSATHKLEAERTRPVAIRLGAWYCPADRWLLEASVSFGSETALRLGAGLFF